MGDIDRKGFADRGSDRNRTAGLANAKCVSGQLSNTVRREWRAGNTRFPMLVGMVHNVEVTGSSQACANRVGRSHATRVGAGAIKCIRHVHRRKGGYRDDATIRQRQVGVQVAQVATTSTCIDNGDAEADVVPMSGGVRGRCDAGARSVDGTTGR